MDNVLKMKHLLERIEVFKKADKIGNNEHEKLTQLIIESSVLCHEIDTEKLLVCGFVKEKYHKRFPELDSIIPNELEYIQAVKVLRNDLKIKNNEELQKIFKPALSMIISVTAATTSGQPLTDQEFAKIDEACIMALELSEAKVTIFEFVDSKTNIIAPNLSALVGATIAAKLIAIAGGQVKLSEIPERQFLMLGAETLEGFSKFDMLPCTGFIYCSDLVKQVPMNFQDKVALKVAEKARLAARLDVSCGKNTLGEHEGQTGETFRKLLEDKIEKLLERPPIKFVKPLPKPPYNPNLERFKKLIPPMKERSSISEMREQQNCMSFDKIKGDANQGLQIDEITNARIISILMKNLDRKNTATGSSNTTRKEVPGTSSVPFTPLQGLEISDPSLVEKMIGEANRKYFSNTSGFTKAKNI